MAFKIVRNDIAKVNSDIIVNTANSKPICASGTDLAIYKGAGKEQLLVADENNKIFSLDDSGARQLEHIFRRIMINNVEENIGESIGEAQSEIE